MPDYRLYFECTAAETSGCINFNGTKFVLADQDNYAKQLSNYNNIPALCRIVGTAFKNDLTSSKGRKENQGSFYLMHTKLEDRLVEDTAVLESLSSNSNNAVQISLLRTEIGILNTLNGKYAENPCLLEHLGIGKDGKCLSYFHLIDNFGITSHMFYTLSRASQGFMPEAMMYLCKQAKYKPEISDDYFASSDFAGIINEMWQRKLYDPLAKKGKTCCDF